MVGVSSRPGKNSKVVREYKAQGNKAMQTGAFQKAMRMYTKALEMDPGNAILYSNRSAAHFNIRQFSESLEDAESAILCDAMWWKAYKRKGLAMIHMQRYEEAITALEEGLQIVGKNAEMEKNLEFARACQEQAQNLYILPEPHMMQRLESVPVFIVTDNVGQPFFVTYDDGQQVCTFYFDKQDAVATLDWIKAENPGLGDTARVIHITLHQAFNLAQETQKQYYEETTRAAAEEDRKAALTAELNTRKYKEDVKKSNAPKSDEKEEHATEQEDDWEEASVSTTDKADGTNDESQEDGDVVQGVPTHSENDGSDAEILVDATAGEQEGATGAVVETKACKLRSCTAEKKCTKDSECCSTGEAKNEEDQTVDDGIIDENAPLSFQFRPELRQVQVAVELLNKHPNPPVRPILRDPPSLRKSKAEAKAKARVEQEAQENAGDGEPEDKDLEGADNSDAKGSDEGRIDEGRYDVEMDAAKVEESKTGDEGAKEGDVDDETGDEIKDEDVDGDDSKALEAYVEDDDDEVELTVDNFNGIPVFQAKGLTLLQKNKQLIPLFFSKWDLEAAWMQLKSTNSMDVPGECDIEVGTLEDVLRRMSESKTDEFESVFFVPSRESMKAINVKFPLDEMSGGSRSGRATVKKAEFSKAKQIAARGGSKEEIRAAIKEDLDKLAERQRMAEVVSQIEHARRSGGVGGVGGFGFGNAATTAGRTRRADAGVRA